MAIKPTQEQEECLETFKKNKFLTIRALSGAGKAQPLDSIVKTPHGDKKIGSIQVGEEIFRSDGTVGKVVGKFPQGGLQPTYKVTFSDGSTTMCNGEHLWSIWEGKRRDKCLNYTLNQIMERGLYDGAEDAKIEIPLTQPVQYPEKQYLIPPYVLGTLIGDGCSNFSFDEKDSGIMGGVTIETHRLGLNVNSKEKFIPLEYMQGSVEQRISLLNGLMDTNGNCVNNCSSFTSTSLQLIKDLRSLVQSLGGIAVETAIDYSSEGPCYTLNVKMFVNPFKVESKASLWKFSSENPPSRYMKDISYVGATEQVCIAVDAEDHLYLTDDFIVTHNTSTLVLLSKSTNERILYMAFNKTMAEDARKKMPDNVECRTLHSICYSFLPVELRYKLTRPEGAYVNVAGTSSEIAKKFKIKNLTDSKGKILASRALVGMLVKNTLGNYEFSDDQNVMRKHFPMSLMKELKKKGISESKLISDVIEYAKKLWRERIDPAKNTLMTHDTYVKMFELSGRDLGYDIIFGDEFQDVNPAFLSILKNAKSAKKIVVVGDENQAIYQWRGSSNMLEQTLTMGEERSLTASFRFGQRVGDIANKIIEYNDGGQIGLKGLGYNTEVGSYRSNFVDTTKPYTIIFRKNMTLLMEAMDRIANGEELSLNIDTRDFVSMVDSVNALRKGDLDRVKHEHIMPYGTWEEFVADAEHNSDAKRLLNIIVTGSAQKIAYTLRNYRPSKNAKVTLTTAHKSKGLEWDQVIVASDFPSHYNKEGKWVGLDVAERNLLYVAHTRAMKCLQWNSTVQELMEISEVDK